MYEAEEARLKAKGEFWLGCF